MTAYTFSTLDAPLGTAGTFAIGINDAGQIVGNYSASVGSNFGFLYSGGSYTSLSVPGAINTFADGINDAGQIVGEYQVDSNYIPQSFLYSEGSYTIINVPGSSNSVATGINSAGEIVGWYSVDNGPQMSSSRFGFLDAGGVYTTISDPLTQPYWGTNSFGINNAGQIVGYFTAGGPLGTSDNGFLFDSATSTFTNLNFPGATFTFANGINDIGEIVGFYVDNSGKDHGFLYSGGSYTTIDNPLGTNGTEAFGINDMGEIVGAYIDSTGLAHGFLATTATMITSPTSVQQEVFGLYAALCDRAADFPGYSFWVGIAGQQSNSGGVTVANASSTAVTLNDCQVLGQAFVSTQASFFDATYGGLSDSQFINALYANIGGNAGDPSGIAHWISLLGQAEAGGESVQAARAGLVGQFVHDLIGIDLTPGAAALGLTTDQYQAALLRQATIENKIAVSLAFSNASSLPGGGILDPHTVGDTAYQAAIAVLQSVTSDPATVTTAITGINNAVAHQDLSLI